MIAFHRINGQVSLCKIKIKDNKYYCIKHKKEVIKEFNKEV